MYNAKTVGIGMCCSHRATDIAKAIAKRYTKLPCFPRRLCRYRLNLHNYKNRPKLFTDANFSTSSRGSPYEQILRRFNIDRLFLRKKSE
mmetsp:Transcript_12759/g.27059  ORF Transcript_12759/g.27059 Transcript_12759/m.27059 type:complete len:89 (-) Transcript_12759:81-347(-)